MFIKCLFVVLLLSQSVMGYRKCCGQNESLSMNFQLSFEDRVFFCKERESTNIWNLAPNGYDLPVTPNGYGLPNCNEYQAHMFTGDVRDMGVRVASYNFDTDRLQVPRYKDAFGPDSVCIEEIKETTYGITCNKCKESGVLCINKCCPFDGPCLITTEPSKQDLIFYDASNKTLKWKENEEYMFVGPEDENKYFFSCEAKVVLDPNTTYQFLDQTGRLHVQEGSTTKVYETKDYCVLENHYFVVCNNTVPFHMDGFNMPPFDMSTISVFEEELEGSVNDNTKNIEDGIKDDNKPANNENSSDAFKTLEEKVDALNKKIEIMNRNMNMKFDLVLEKISSLHN